MEHVAAGGVGRPRGPRRRRARHHVDHRPRAPRHRGGRQPRRRPAHQIAEGGQCIEPGAAAGREVGRERGHGARAREGVDRCRVIACVAQGAQEAAA